MRATETDTGSGPSAAAPRSFAKRRLKRPANSKQPRSLGDDLCAVARARIAGAFYALRRVGEADIRQGFAFRFASLAALPMQEALAARSALLQEQESMLEALRVKLEGEEKAFAAREQAPVATQKKAAGPPAVRSPGQAMRSVGFRHAAEALVRRPAGKARPHRPRLVRTLASCAFRRD